MADALPEAVFAAWALRVEGGEALDCDDLLRAHPMYEQELRRLYDDWQFFAPLLGKVVPGMLASNASIVAAPLSRDDEHAVELPSSELLDRLRIQVPNSGRYRFRAVIGRGGGGVVLKVWDTKLNRPLAMKVVLGRGEDRPTSDTPMVDGRALARFVDEARIASQLNHPGIVPVHELGADDAGRAFFTMKLVKGEDLSLVFDHVKTGHDGWNQTRALGVLLRVCEAMAYAHAKLVIHRDLKPANVMVGPYGEVYVMDWGLARVVGEKDPHDLRIRPLPLTPATMVDSVRRPDGAGTPHSPLMTMEGTVVGTPAYMSPEQAKGDLEQVGVRSDVYAIGAMLYELSVGRAPFVRAGERPTPQVVWMRVAQGPPDPLHALAPRAPAELVAICEKAMARDSEQRYSDTRELALDLRAFLERRVVHAYEAGAWAETKKWLQRNKPLAASLAAGVLLLAAGLATSLLFKARADEKAAETAKQAGIATRKASDVLSLSAIQELKELLERADALWPALPDKVRAYDDWLADAKVLVDGRAADPARGLERHPSLKDHEAQLSEIRQRAKELTPEQIEADRRASPSFAEWEQERAKLTWLRRMLGAEPWPREADIEASLEQETLPSDANGLNALVRPLVDSDPAKIVYGSEVKALVLAKRAVAAAKETERAGIHETLGWALYRSGRIDEALVEEPRLVDEAKDEQKKELSASLKQLQEQIATWKTADSRTKQADAAATLAAQVADLEREVSERRTYEFNDAQDRWWHAQLSLLVGDLKAFVNEKTGLFSEGTSEHGWGIVKRRKEAATIEQRSVNGAEAKRRWDEAIAAIAESVKYDGLVLSPQLGLLPIGEDQASHLWEFAHLESGEPPQRGVDGKLILKEEMGLVFVLIPAGRFWMGAQKTDRNGQNYDPQALDVESPVHEALLSPYFLSKYEMTQGQWERFTGRNPSHFRKANYSSIWDKAGKGGSALHPVEQVTWANCMEVLGRLGFELPTEAQWENGCRGGTSSVYWSGDGLEGFGGVANIADAYGHANGGSGFPLWEKDIDDGHSVHAEVGSYQPNAFGLHDVHGNVWEWCLDAFAAYTAGKQVDPVSRWTGGQNCVSRGGGFVDAAYYARSALRSEDGPEHQGNDLGLRPARGITP